MKKEYEIINFDEVWKDPDDSVAIYYDFKMDTQCYVPGKSANDVLKGLEAKAAIKAMAKKLNKTLKKLKSIAESVTVKQEKTANGISLKYTNQQENYQKR